MPVLDPRERSFPVLPFLMAGNLFPLIGVLFYGFGFFALFYLYWWETVIISIFQWLKMGRAELQSKPDPKFLVNNKPLSDAQVNSRRYMRRLYFFVRGGLLAFYLIFIIVFTGSSDAGNGGDMIDNFVLPLMLKVPWMQVSLLVFFISHAVEYRVWIYDKDYKTTSLTSLGNPIDGRTIIMHIVIVLGTFLSAFVTNSLFPENPRAGVIAYASLFVLLKILVDLYAYATDQRRGTLLAKYMNRSSPASGSTLSD